MLTGKGVSCSTSRISINNFCLTSFRTRFVLDRSLSRLNMLLFGSFSVSLFSSTGYQLQKVTFAAFGLTFEHRVMKLWSPSTNISRTARKAMEL